MSLPARVPFYWGWVNVVVAAAAMSGTFPGRSYALGLVKVKLCTELGVSDFDFNALNFWAVIIGASAVLPVGRLIDRLGSRLTLAGVVLLLGVSTLLMAAVPAGEFWKLAVTLTLVRGFGQGALSVVAIALVGKWFRRRSGLAMGVFGILLGVGFVAPTVVVKGVVEAGPEVERWREGWNMVGWSLLLGLLPLGLLLARSTPESAGVKPDDPAPDAEQRAVMRVGEALRTPAFWVWTAAATLFNFAFTAFTLDVEPLMNEHQLNGARMKDVVGGVLLVSGLPANYLAGWLAKRVPLGRLLGVGTLLLALSLVVFPWVRSDGAAVAFAALLGASGGVVMVVYFAVYGHTFGRTHLGGIQAVVQVFSVFASAVGPVLLAWVRKENGGDTGPFFLASAGVCAALAVGAWAVKPPR